MQQISQIEKGEVQEKQTKKKETSHLKTISSMISETSKSIYDKFRKWTSPNPKTQTNQQITEPSQTTPEITKPIKSKKINSNNKLTLREWITEITGYILVILFIMEAFIFSLFGLSYIISNPMYRGIA